MEANNGAVSGKTLKGRQYTHDGQLLTDREYKFICSVVEHGNHAQAVRDAGYRSKRPDAYATQLLRKPSIADEIKYRLKKFEEQSVANGLEIRQYLTGVMRGEIKDQFGLETPISERTKAAQELARLQSIDDRNQTARGSAQVTISLDWGGMEAKSEGNGEEGDDGQAGGE